jgi:hypothetical protein
MKALRGVAALLVTAFGLWTGATSVSADDEDGGHVCSGSLANPGVLAPGTYHHLVVSGLCVIPGGRVVVRDGVSINSDSTLLANFPPIPNRFPEGDATVLIRGNALVGDGATLVLGCSPHLGCANTTHDEVFGNIRGDDALGILLHSDQIFGNVSQEGGGGGTTCTPTGIFTALANPVFSDYEDDLITGRIQVAGLRSCWLGLARDQVGQSAVLAANTLADPDAIEILANHISDDLVCVGNSMVWDSAEAMEGQPGLYPRVPEPNDVDGHRVGQCRLASPPSAGAPPGPGPF